MIFADVIVCTIGWRMLFCSALVVLFAQPSVIHPVLPQRKVEEDVEHNYRVVRFEVMPKSVKLEGKSLVMQRNVKVKLHEKL